MEFIVIARDGTDADAPARRANARQEHIERAAAFREAGNLLYAAAMQDESENSIGSVMVLDFDERAALDAWLEEEPYVLKDVWREVEIRRAKVAP